MNEQGNKIENNKGVEIDIEKIGDKVAGGGHTVSGTHSQYGKCIVRCVCGATFETESTEKEIMVDICSKCHPFYNGKQKPVDTGGRVDRFKKRYGF